MLFKRAYIFSFWFLLSPVFLSAQQPKLILPIGHNELIKSVSFSPDGKKIITASYDNTAKIWDAQNGLLLGNLKYHTAPVNTVAFSPDGKKIVTGSEDGTAILWETVSGRMIRRLNAGSGYVNFARFSPDGRKVLLCTADGALETIEDFMALEELKTSITYQPAFASITIWDVHSGKKQCELNGDALSVFAPEFSPDSEQVLSPGPDSSAIIWDASTGKQLVKFKTHTNLVLNARYSPDGKKIITASWDKTAKIWNATTGQLLITLSGHSAYVSSAVFSQDGERIVTASSDGSSKTWDAGTGKLLADFSTGSDLFYFACFSPDNKKIVAVSFNGPPRLWEPLTGKPIADLFHEGELSKSNPTVSIPAFSPDGKKLLTLADMTTISVWNTLTGTRQFLLKGLTKEFHSAGFSNDGRKIITACFDSTAKIWDAGTMTLQVNLKGHTGIVYDARFSSDGKRAVTASYDSTCIIWDAITGNKLMVLKGHDEILRSACFSPDGKKIVTASWDYTAVVWDAITGKRMNVLKGHNGFVQRAVFSPNGKNIITASDDAKVYRWNAVTGEMEDSILMNDYTSSAEYSPDGTKLITAYSHDDHSVVTVWSMPSQKKLFDLKGNDGSKYLHGEIYFAGFSPDGKKIVTASADHTAKIWNAFSGKLVYSLKGHELDVVSAGFSPDSKKLITTSWDHTIRIWDIQKGKLVNTLLAVKENDYLSQIPQGYYQATRPAAQLLYYVNKNLQIITFEQLDVKYNRPDKVLEAIGNADTGLIRSYRKAYEKRIKKLGIDTTAFRDGYSVPEADFANRDQVDYEQKNGSLKLQIKGLDSAFKLDRFNVWVNETPVYGQRGISISKRNKNDLDTTITIQLSQGENRIETSIANVNGTESYRMPLIVNYIPAIKQKETTRFIGIGIDQFADNEYNLQYSVKDIRDLADSLKRKYKENITIDTLFNTNVTVSNVKALKKKIQQTTENDKVIIAYSGHGLLSKDYDYFLSTYAVNFDKPEQNGLPYEELEKLLDSIPARKKLLLIDACHSGEVDKEDLVAINTGADTLKLKKGVTPVAYKQEGRIGLKNSFELMQSLFVNVGKSTGATVISAAAGTQFALERNDLKNGVFTYSILEAMNKYPTLKISELKKIVGERVEELTKGLQKPTSRNETIAVDWQIW